jgi:hypothetical protein
MHTFTFIRHYPTGFLKDNKALFIEAETQLSAMVNQFFIHEDYLFVVAISEVNNGHLMFTSMGQNWPFLCAFQAETVYIYREPNTREFKSGKVGTKEEIWLKSIQSK